MTTPQRPRRLHDTRICTSCLQEFPQGRGYAEHDCPGMARPGEQASTSPPFDSEMYRGEARRDIDKILGDLNLSSSAPQVKELMASAWYFGYTTGMADAAAFEELAASGAGHAIDVKGPIDFPGGKNGSFIAYCSCQHWASAFGTETEVRKDGADHARSQAKKWNPMKQAFE